jgi:hypothetical protein
MVFFLFYMLIAFAKNASTFDKKIRFDAYLDIDNE